MTVRDLCDEITDRLLKKPQTPNDIAKALNAETDALGTEVLYAIEGLKSAGWLIEIDGKLYVQGPPEAA